MPQKIIFVRHGETPYNKLGKFMGWDSDVGLSEVGISEAGQVGNRLIVESIDYIYSSDLRRTKETADIISNILQKSHTSIMNLRERNLGIFAEHTFHEVKERWPDHANKFLSHSERDWNGLKGESLAQVCNRFEQLMSDLKANHANQSVLLITHSGFIHTILRDYFHFFPTESYEEVGHTSITVLEKSNNQYILAKYNSIA